MNAKPAKEVEKAPAGKRRSSKYSGRAAKPSMERMYELIRAPVITEKVTRLSEHSQVAFRVPLDASKPEIKAAVETLFKVKVTAVNTLRRKGKIKRFRGHVGRQSDSKRAIVTLAEGQTIDVTTGV